MYTYSSLSFSVAIEETDDIKADQSKYGPRQLYDP